MKIKFIGTGQMIATPTRGPSCYLFGKLAFVIVARDNNCRSNDPIPNFIAGF